MRWIIVYVATAVIMLPLDLIFLSTVGKKLFTDNVGEMILQSPRMPAAILFYLIYLGGVVIFVNGATPGNWQHNLLYGALFGLVCYSTFELTNMALLRGWQWAVVLPDIAWGAIVTAVAASVGGLLAGWIMARIG